MAWIKQIEEEPWDDLKTLLTVNLIIVTDDNGDKTFHMLLLKLLISHHRLERNYNCHKQTVSQRSKKYVVSCFCLCERMEWMFVIVDVTSHSVESLTKEVTTGYLAFTRGSAVTCCHLTRFSLLSLVVNCVPVPAG